MPTETMMSLGDYRFSADAAAYRELERSQSFRWQAQQRLAAPPAYQYLGPGADAISLRGVLYPHHRGGLGQIHALRAEAGRGKPLLLTTGNGEALGRWCVTRIDETQRLFFADGKPRQVEFRLRLVYYGEDGGDKRPERFTLPAAAPAARLNPQAIGLIERQAGARLRAQLGALQPPDDLQKQLNGLLERELAANKPPPPLTLRKRVATALLARLGKQASDALLPAAVNAALHDRIAATLRAHTAGLTAQTAMLAQVRALAQAQLAGRPRTAQAARRLDALLDEQLSAPLPHAKLQNKIAALLAAAGFSS